MELGILWSKGAKKKWSLKYYKKSEITLHNIKLSSWSSNKKCKWGSSEFL